MNFADLCNQIEAEINSGAEKISAFEDYKKWVADALKVIEERKDDNATLLDLITNDIAAEAIPQYAMAFISITGMPVHPRVVEILNNISLSDTEGKFSLPRILGNGHVTDGDRQLVRQLNVAPIDILDVIHFGSMVLFYTTVKSVLKDNDLSPEDFAHYIVVALLFVMYIAKTGESNDLVEELRKTFGIEVEETNNKVTNLGDNVILFPGPKSIH